MKKAVFPGSFDPITIGHLDIVKRGIKIFDEIIIAVGDTTDKNICSQKKKEKSLLREHLVIMIRSRLSHIMG